MKTTKKELGYLVTGVCAGALAMLGGIRLMKKTKNVGTILRTGWYEGDRSKFYIMIDEINESGNTVHLAATQVTPEKAVGIGMAMIGNAKECGNLSNEDIDRIISNINKEED